MQQKIYNLIPHAFQNLLLSVYNYRAYKVRYGGKYKHFLNIFKENKNLTREQLINLNKIRYKNFILDAIKNSPYYSNLYSNIQNPDDLSNIRSLPILNKEVLRTNIKNIVIKSNEKLLSNKTGGTTGKSLEIFMRKANQQERIAMLDAFRSKFGYKLGRKTAWFSGKGFLNNRDVEKKRFWKTDIFNNVRYYSTFHLKDEYLKYYVENLIKFKPEFFSGFPSSMYEISKYGIRNRYDYPADTIKAIFPTAETTTTEMRNSIETFFKTKMFDQYASSEGAPFIFECSNNNLHLELQSGVFEVLDQDNNPAKSGRLIVTSFTSEATPLIRYDIGDSITLDEESKLCGCGNNNPLVKEILGRKDDYVYSPENGKVNIINIANAIKDVKGIIRYQIVQNELNELIFNIVIDKSIYSKKSEALFLENWRARVGNKMELNIRYLDEIPNETSGKFRIVKNNIKHLINA